MVASAAAVRAAAIRAATVGTSATAVTTAAVLGQCGRRRNDEGERSDSCEKSFQQGGRSHWVPSAGHPFEDAINVLENRRGPWEGNPAFGNHTPAYFIWSRNLAGELPKGAV